MRLIDADALLEEIRGQKENGFPANVNLDLYAESCVLHAPTILSGWIKVTPETMPPDMEPVLVTVVYSPGKREVVSRAMFCKELNQWMCSQVYTDGWSDIDLGAVTHWMPYPKPAED